MFPVEKPLILRPFSWLPSLQRWQAFRKFSWSLPPRKEGISPAVLVAADLAGVDRIYRIGGVQAIAALAYGTKSIPKVDKIVGPGNQYVATAKRLVYGDVDIDMVAGPSEIVIVSDENTPPSFVAADLISQAEHDEMALAILITTSEAFGREVKKEVERQLSSLKRRKVASASLNRRGAILIVKNLEQAMELVNRIAPEHLELAVSRPLSLIKSVKHAGAVFLGPYTPEAIGDYMAGPNHILPTAGTARFSSPLGVEDFIKRTNLMSFTQSALKRFEKDVKRFAEWEGLEGHYQAVQKRMEKPERTRLRGGRKDEETSEGRGEAKDKGDRRRLKTESGWIRKTFDRNGNPFLRSHAQSPGLSQPHGPLPQGKGRYRCGCTPHRGRCGHLSGGWDQKGSWRSERNPKIRDGHDSDG